MSDENDPAELEVIGWDGDRLRFLDQTLLPLQTRYVLTAEYRAVIDALKRLAIRGAPLIGIAAAYGVALAAKQIPDASRGELLRVCDEFAASRPTAINLFWALEKAREIIRTGGSSAGIKENLAALAAELHEDDRRRCDLIARHGADLLLSVRARRAVPDDAPLNVITHCNTGARATGGIGTALGIILEAHRRGGNIHVYVDETRPLLQGARLTAWELRRRGIPHTLITDSTAAALMLTRTVAAALIGADRIARNGDTANKIGSYALAIAARAHGVPFYVAAPQSTIDASISSGDQIPIEQRSAEDILRIGGTEVAPERTPVYAPAFDVVPHELIDAIVTEAGIHRPPLFLSIGARNHD